MRRVVVGIALVGVVLGVACSGGSTEGVIVEKHYEERECTSQYNPSTKTVMVNCDDEDWVFMLKHCDDTLVGKPATCDVGRREVAESVWPEYEVGDYYPRPSPTSPPGGEHGG